MSQDQAIAEAAEAVCGALHRLDFQFLGESEDGASTWFHRGQYPKDVRIEVVRSALAPMVLVNLTWRNLSERPIQIGRKTLQVDVRGAQQAVFEATETAVLRCLQIFRDVVEGEGVAGPGILKPITPIDSGDLDAPETDDEAREAGLSD
jgi:hypothetical protein